MNRYSFLLIFFALLSGYPAQAQDAAKGEAVFKKCVVCHAVGENARNKVGPKLNGIIGSKAAGVEDYSYSPAMKNSNVTWTDDVFTTYITNPHLMIPGSKMAFAGISNEQDIKDLIAYLKKFKADGTAN